MTRTILALIAALSLGSQALAGEWQRLIGPADLATLAGNVVVLDIRGPAEYAKGHVAGALNAPYPSWRGPKDNPGQTLDDAALTERMQSLGLDRADRVVVTYAGKDATDFGAAARVYWTLKSAGLTEIAILNGGIAAWTGVGHALTTETASVTRSSGAFTLADDWMITREGVRAVVDGRTDAQIIDARPLPFLQGKKKHKAAKVAGTIEGAAQITHSTWFTGDGKRRVTSVDDVVRLAREAGVETGEARPIASFCNTGHWAATNWFALSEMAGIKNVKLYPESMVGWTKADQPVVTTE